MGEPKVRQKESHDDRQEEKKEGVILGQERDGKTQESGQAQPDAEKEVSVSMLATAGQQQSPDNIRVGLAGEEATQASEGLGQPIQA